MWAIETKYYGPTNTRGSRVKACFGDCGMRVILDWDNSLNPEENYRAAAEELRRRMVAAGRWSDWQATCPLIMASVREGHVFVFNHGA